MTQSTPVSDPASVSGRREQNKAEKRARILAAADALFAAQGYEGTTMAQVAQDAAVAIGTVFQYAATKPELLMMVAAERWSDVAADLLQTNPGEDQGGLPGAVRAIERVLEPVVSASLAQPEVSMVIARELLFGARGPHRQAVESIITEVEDAVAAILQAHGAGADSEVAASLVVSGCLLELNRTRMGRAQAGSLRKRLHRLVSVTSRGAGIA